jgi:hypothetical protein
MHDYANCRFMALNQLWLTSIERGVPFQQL